MNETTPRIGLDLCGISRMQKLLNDKRFLERYFTTEEQEYILSKGRASAQSMAGIYAAKEALCKALGTGIAFPLKEIGITHTQTGQPAYCLTGRVAERTGNDIPLLSISHEGDMAAAVCLIIHIPERSHSL